MSETATEDITDKNYLFLSEPLMVEELNSSTPPLAVNTAEWTGQPAQLVLVTGFVGCGKSTVLSSLRAKGFVVIEVDDEETNTPASKGMKNHRVYQTLVFALATGRPVAIANGGGFFFDQKKGIMTIIKELTKRAPFDVQIAAVLHPLTTDGAEAKTVVAVKSRIQRGVYTIETKRDGPEQPGVFESETVAIGVLTGVTKRNFPVQEAILGWAKTQNVPIVHFDTIYQDDTPPAVKFSDDSLLSKIGSTTTAIDAEIKTTFGYHLRIGPWLCHITYAYGAPMAQAQEFLSRPIPQSFTAQKVIIGEKYHAYAINVGADISYFGADRSPHASIDAPYEAVHNGTAVTAALKGQKSVIINSKKCGEKEWSLVLEPVELPVQIIRSYAYAV